MRSRFPKLPAVTGASGVVLAHMQRPKIMPPATPQPLGQERGLRHSRALPYTLHVDAKADAGGALALDFVNLGTSAVVFHVYDRRDLDLIPRRYTVEAGKSLADQWRPHAEGDHDLWILGPNGFLRTVEAKSLPVSVRLRHDARRQELVFTLRASHGATASLRDTQYGTAPDRTLALPANRPVEHRWPVGKSKGWYDVSVEVEGTRQRFAGRLETGAHGVTDPALA